jgi:hypothetical protein
VTARNTLASEPLQRLSLGTGDPHAPPGQVARVELS